MTIWVETRRSLLSAPALLAPPPSLAQACGPDRCCKWREGTDGHSHGGCSQESTTGILWKPVAFRGMVGVRRFVLFLQFPQFPCEYACGDRRNGCIRPLERSPSQRK